MSATPQSHPHELHSRVGSDSLQVSKPASSKAGPSSRSRSPRPSKSRANATGAPPSPPAPTKLTHPGFALFDAIVQAADPKHPEHGTWQDKFGSLSSRSSRASASSSQNRDHVAVSSPATEASRKSFDQSDVTTRKKHAARMARDGYTAYRQTNEAAGSDADDPFPKEGRYTPVRASYEGSIRSYSSSTFTSTSQRRRNRRMRESPKPLEPPVPPPRVSSSTQWQSIHGSASMVDLSSSIPRTSAYFAGPASTGDHTRSSRLIASPSAPALLRMAHPYASAVTLPDLHEQESAPVPSASSARLAPQPSAKGKARQIREDDTTSLLRPEVPEKASRTRRQDLQVPAPSSAIMPAPAVPPKNIARRGYRKTGSLTRVPVPELTSPDAKAMKGSADDSQQVDHSVFPMRRDDEFRTNEFEMSDASEPERDDLSRQLPLPNSQHTPSVSAPAAGKGPGKVRRSFDSILSPFRAGLLNGGASESGRAAMVDRTNLAIPEREPIAQGRRSFSDSRFVRPLLLRPRDATAGRNARPLSKVIDQTEEEIIDVSHNNDARHIPKHPHASDSVGNASPSQLTSARSNNSSYSHATSNLHDTASLQPKSRGKFGSLMSRLKGSVATKGSPATTTREAVLQSTWTSSQTLYQDHRGAAQDHAVSASPSVAATTPAASFDKKADRGLRSRVKSLTSLASPRSKNDAADLPPVPAIPANFAATESETTHSVWEESPRAPSAPTFASQNNPRSLGRLLRLGKGRGETNDNIANALASPSKTSFSQSAVFEALPRASMSSVRGFDVEEPADRPAGLAQSRTTIRKTLSPALLRDEQQPSIDAGVRQARLASPSEQEAYSHGAHGEAVGYGAKGDDDAEDFRRHEEDQQGLRSQRSRRAHRVNPRVDRLSRVEELSERLSYIADLNDAAEEQATTSTTRDSPTPRRPRSFSEHRSLHNTSVGSLREQTLPRKLDLATMEEERPHEDLPRPTDKQPGSGSLDVDGINSAASLASAGLDTPATAVSASAPKSPATPGLVSQLTPTWRSTTLSTPASGRTSFSQDRDRAPVASPISPPLPTKRGVGQAIKKLGIKGKVKKGGKGIGPNDLIELDFDDDEECVNDVSLELGSRPSISESGSSFGGGARPSFSAVARPSFGMARPSYDAPRGNSLMAAEMATKQLEVEANALMQSPFMPSSGSEGVEHLPPTPSRKAPRDVPGQGLDPAPWAETFPSRKSIDISGSTSEGTFTSQGIQTPDNGSLSHSSQLPTRSDLTGATTPLAGRGSMDTGSQMTVALKSPELLAFEDMLGRFPQQQKVLLQDISARVAKTPVLGSAGWTSREDL